MQLVSAQGGSCRNSFRCLRLTMKETKVQKYPFSEHCIWGTTGRGGVWCINKTWLTMLCCAFKTACWLLSPVTQCAVESRDHGIQSKPRFNSPFFFLIDTAKGSVMAYYSLPASCFIHRGGDAVFPYSVSSSSLWYKAAATNRVETHNQVPRVCIGTPNH